jgi:hypothetical protein
MINSGAWLLEAFAWFLKTIRSFFLSLRVNFRPLGKPRFLLDVFS